MVLHELLKDKIKAQVEFYFSDSNLPRDKFLLEQVNNNEEGWVPIAMICTFSRMAEALGLKKGTKQEAVGKGMLQDVVEALKDCSSLELSEDGTKVKRTQPLPPPEEAVRAVNERSLYVAPLPYDATLEALSRFFAEQAPVASVRLRRHATSKQFKGSVFVEFETPETAKQLAQAIVEAAVVEGLLRLSLHLWPGQ